VPCITIQPIRARRRDHNPGRNGYVVSVAWSRYGEFLAFVVVLVLIPGPDFAVVARNTLAGGRQRGRWAAAGVTVGNVIQGTAAALGLSELIARAQPVFQAIRWAGVAYLGALGILAVVSAVRGRYQAEESPAAPGGTAPGPRRAVAWWQGLLSNITNPKILVFYLAVLPQFLVYGAGLGWSLLLAWSAPVIGFFYLLALVGGMHHARAMLMRRRVRRCMDGATGAALLGFAAALAADSA
jgi:threonine/homoserine/homoserine lactone efflux protein